MLPHELRVLLHRFAERAEDDSELGQLALHRRADGNGIEDRVDGDARKPLLLVERYAELGVRAEQLGIDLVEAPQLRGLLGRRVIADALVVYLRIGDVRPVRLLHREPPAIGFQTPLEQPLRLVLLERDQPDGIFAEPGRHGVGLDVRHPPVLIFAIYQCFDRCAHAFSRYIHPA